MRRLLSADADTSTVEYFHTHDGKLTIERTQDVAPIVEQAKAQFNDTDERARYGEGWTRVATIPNILYYQLVKLGIAHDPAAMKKWLNERDNRYFRVRPGKV